MLLCLQHCLLYLFIVLSPVIMSIAIRWCMYVTTIQNHHNLSNYPSNYLSFLNLPLLFCQIHDAPSSSFTFPSLSTRTHITLRYPYTLSRMSTLLIPRSLVPILNYWYPILAVLAHMAVDHRPFAADVLPSLNGARADASLIASIHSARHRYFYGPR